MKKKKHISPEKEIQDYSVDVKFYSDNDAFEIIYVNGSKTQKIGNIILLVTFIYR
jgi:hypothetical protein